MRNIVLIVAAIVLLWPTAASAQGCYGGSYSSSCYSQTYSSTQVYSSVQTSAPVYAAPAPVYAAPVYAAPVHTPMFAAPMRGRFKQVFKMRGRGFFGAGAPVCGAGGCY